MATYKDASELLAEGHKAAELIAELVEILSDMQYDLDEDQEATWSKAAGFLGHAKIARSL